MEYVVKANILAGRSVAKAQSVKRQRGSEGRIVETDRMAELSVFTISIKPVRISATRRLKRRTRSDLWMGMDLAVSATAVRTFKTMAAASMSKKSDSKAVNPGDSMNNLLGGLEQLPSVILQSFICVSHQSRG